MAPDSRIRDFIASPIVRQVLGLKFEAGFRVLGLGFRVQTGCGL